MILWYAAKLGVSPKRAEMACMLADGLSSREIAERLQLPLGATRMRLRRLCDAIGVRTKAQLGCEVGKLS